MLYFANTCRSSVKFDDIQRDLVKIQRYLVEILSDSAEFQPDLASFSHISLPWLQLLHEEIRLTQIDSSSWLMASPNIGDPNWSSWVRVGYKPNPDRCVDNHDFDEPHILLFPNYYYYYCCYYLTKKMEGHCNSPPLQRKVSLQLITDEKKKKKNYPKTLFYI